MVVSFGIKRVVKSASYLILQQLILPLFDQFGLRSGFHRNLCDLLLFPQPAHHHLKPVWFRTPVTARTRVRCSIRVQSQVFAHVDPNGNADPYAAHAQCKGPNNAPGGKAGMLIDPFA